MAIDYVFGAIDTKKEAGWSQFLGGKIVPEIERNWHNTIESNEYSNFSGFVFRQLISSAAYIHSYYKRHSNAVPNAQT